MFNYIADLRRTGGTKAATEFPVAKIGGLRSELERWLEVKNRWNGAASYEVEHHVLTLSGVTDASSRGLRGLVRSPGVADDKIRGFSRRMV